MLKRKADGMRRGAAISSPDMRQKRPRYLLDDIYVRDARTHTRSKHLHETANMEHEVKLFPRADAGHWIWGSFIIVLQGDPAR